MTGALAIPVAWLATAKSRHHDRLIVVWNAFGASDLVVAVTLGDHVEERISVAANSRRGWHRGDDNPAMVVGPFGLGAVLPHSPRNSIRSTAREFQRKQPQGRFRRTASVQRADAGGLADGRPKHLKHRETRAAPSDKITSAPDLIACRASAVLSARSNPSPAISMTLKPCAWTAARDLMLDTSFNNRDGRVVVRGVSFGSRGLPQENITCSGCETSYRVSASLPRGYPDVSLWHKEPIDVKQRVVGLLG